MGSRSKSIIMIAMWAVGACTVQVPAASGTGPLPQLAPPCEDAASCDQQCQRWDGRSCARLGEFYVQAGKRHLAAAAFQRACQVGHPEACRRVAAAPPVRPAVRVRAARGDGPRQDRSTAAESKRPADSSQQPLRGQTGCDDGHSGACIELAVQQAELARRGKLPWERVLATFKRACSLGDNRGCERAANFKQLLAIEARRRATDQREALPGGAGCQRGDADACMQLALAQSSLAREGKVPWEEVETTLRSACILGSCRACLAVDDVKATHGAHLQARPAGTAVPSPTDWRYRSGSWRHRPRKKVRTFVLAKAACSEATLTRDLAPVIRDAYQGCQKDPNHDGAVAERKACLEAKRQAQGLLRTLFRGDHKIRIDPSVPRPTEPPYDRPWNPGGEVEFWYPDAYFTKISNCKAVAGMEVLFKAKPGTYRAIAGITTAMRPGGDGQTGCGPNRWQLRWNNNLKLVVTVKLR